MKLLFNAIVLFFCLVNIANSYTVKFEIKFDETDINYSLDKTLISKNLETALIDNGFTLTNNSLTPDILIFIGITTGVSEYNDLFLLSFSSFSIIFHGDGTISKHSQITPFILFISKYNYKEAEEGVILDIKNYIFLLKQSLK